MKNLFKNKIFWFIICIIIALVSGLFYNIFGIITAGVIFKAALIYPVGLVFTVFIFTWIINPIKLLISYIKKKK